VIKAIIFDLDGVLVELKEAHFLALNRALEEVDYKYVISLDEHYSLYDGLPTKDKLKLLTENKGLPPEFYIQININKQKYTIDYIITTIERDDNLILVLEKLKKQGFQLAVASNSVRQTIYSVLVKKEIVKYIDVILSNQEVTLAKPNPEIYLQTFSKLGLKPKECLILEDSPYGLESANDSGGYVLKINEPHDVTYEILNKEIEKIDCNKIVTKYDGKNFNVLIAMAGLGNSFKQAGYTFPKPLIDINQKPMIQMVVENLNINAHFIYLVQKSIYEEYNLKYLLNILTPNCDIIQVDGDTGGAACTTLLAKKFINNNKHLIIANSDQFIEWDSNRFYYSIVDEKIDAGILCFNNFHPKWSYAKVDDNGFVVEVAEKKVISDLATCGIYYWAKGSDYVKYAEQMINKNIRHNNEFYVCPVFNQAIEDDKKIKTYKSGTMWGLGDPEGLEYFLEHYKIKK